jgi:DNA recombination protein RmuC
MGQLGRLTGDLGRFRDDFRVLGRHLGNAAQAHGAAERRLERLQGKLGSIAGGEDEPEPEPAPVQRSLLRATT